MKKVFLMLTAAVILTGLFLSSCNKKEITNEEIQKNEPVNLKPIENFTIAFKKTGDYSTNDENFMNNNPRIKNAVSHIANSISKKKSLNDVSFIISEDGRINSPDEDYNGKLFAEVLLNEGGMSYSDKDFTVIFDNNGFKSIDDESVFSIYPHLQQDLIDAGESYKEKLADNETLSLTFSGNKFFVNGEEIPLFNYTKTPTWDEFRDCVGWYWWAPILNVIFCGAGELMQ